jgi:hypothetical protein
MPVDLVSEKHRTDLRIQVCNLRPLRYSLSSPFLGTVESNWETNREGAG